MGVSTSQPMRKDPSVVLMRRLLGDVLRRRRTAQGRTLREVAASARVSLGYLSEVERGRKEASSELLAAICAALGVPLSVVMREVSDELARAEAAALGALGAPGGSRGSRRAPSEMDLAHA
jgi:transcriptional regulator with XRE-family HTH domain